MDKAKVILMVSMASLAIAACGDGTRSTSQAKIEDGTVDAAAGSSVVLVSDLRLGSCTGTVLSRRHVLTAAHCVQGGTGAPFVNVYGPAEATPRVAPYRVSQIAIPDGIDARRRDFLSDEGVYADLAVLTLENDLPSDLRPVSLASRYPGAGRVATVVGAGEHDGRRNGGAELRSRQVSLFGGNDAGGAIVSDGTFVNGGDSGGPLFEGARRGAQLGVLSGTVDYRGRTLDRYTSVSEPRNRAWIRAAQAN